MSCWWWNLEIIRAIDFQDAHSRSNVDYHVWKYRFLRCKVNTTHCMRYGAMAYKVYVDDGLCLFFPFPAEDSSFGVLQQKVHSLKKLWLQFLRGGDCYDDELQVVLVWWCDGASNLPAKINSRKSAETRNSTRKNNLFCYRRWPTRHLLLLQNQNK